MLLPEITATALPPTQEEIARASDDEFRIHWSWGTVDFEASAYLEFLLVRSSACPECALAEDVGGCMRRLSQLRVSRLRCRPRARARRRRRRHGGSRGERSPPSDDGDGDGGPPPAPLQLASRDALACPGGAS
jgi:hypothetical protein